MFARLLVIHRSRDILLLLFQIYGPGQIAERYKQQQTGRYNNREGDKFN